MANMDNNHVTGFNIYTNNKGQDIYYDRFRKNGYVITSDKARLFGIYQNRYLLIVVAVILASNFILKWQACIIIGLCAAIIVEGLFRLKFLPSCTTITGFVPTEKVKMIDQIAQRDDKGRIALKAILFLCLGVLIVTNAYLENYDLLLLVGSWIVGVVAIFFAIIHFIALSKKKGSK